jgi:hypothetical protein
LRPRLTTGLPFHRGPGLRQKTAEAAATFKPVPEKWTGGPKGPPDPVLLA